MTGKQDDLLRLLTAANLSNDVGRFGVGLISRFEREMHASRAADIDVVYTSGYGFPAWRGGPMFYADRVGLAKVYERVSAFHRELGQRWKPAPLLERLAREGSTFKAFDKGRASELAGTTA